MPSYHEATSSCVLSMIISKTPVISAPPDCSVKLMTREWRDRPSPKRNLGITLIVAAVCVRVKK